MYCRYPKSARKIVKYDVLSVHLSGIPMDVHVKLKLLGASR